MAGGVRDRASLPQDAQPGRGLSGGAVQWRGPQEQLATGRSTGRRQSLWLPASAGAGHLVPGGRAGGPLRLRDGSFGGPAGGADRGRDGVSEEGPPLGGSGAPIQRHGGPHRELPSRGFSGVCRAAGGHPAGPGPLSAPQLDGCAGAPAGRGSGGGHTLCHPAAAGAADAAAGGRRLSAPQLDGCAGGCRP